MARAHSKQPSERGQMQSLFTMFSEGKAVIELNLTATLSSGVGLLFNFKTSTAQEFSLFKETLAAGKKAADIQLLIEKE